MKSLLKRPDLGVLFSGLLPLFVLAHFGHHIVGAMLRPLMPMIRTELGLNYTQAGVVFSAFAITYGIAQLPAGWLADRLGARVMVAISISGVALAGVAVGLSQTYLLLVVFLVLAALLGGGYHPAAAAAISASIAPQRRGRALGIHLIGGSSAFWAVPLIAAPIAVAWGWRVAYISLAMPAFVLGVALYLLLGRRQRRILAGLPAQTAPPPPVETVRIRWRRLVPFIVMSVSAGTLVQSVLSYVALYAVDGLGVAEGTAAMLVAVMPAVGLVAAPLGGYLSDKLGRIPVLLAVCLLSAPLLYLMGLATTVPALVVVMLLLGLASNTRMPTSEAFIAGETPPSRRSTILGIYFFAGAEVAGLVTPVIGNLIDRYGFEFTFTAASLSLAAVTLVSAFFLWTARGQAEAAGGPPGNDGME